MARNNFSHYEMMRCFHCFLLAVFLLPAQGPNSPDEGHEAVQDISLGSVGQDNTPTKSSR